MLGFLVLLSHVYYFSFAVLSRRKMNPDTLFAQGDAGYPIGLHGGRIRVVVNIRFARCFSSIRSP